MKTLREGIILRYQAYHVLNRDKFPDFEYNTNRANYEPLRTSFEEELYIAKGIDRANPTIHIPSTNTLALLFTDDRYIPNKKILNTCQLYADPSPRSVTVPDSLDTFKPPTTSQTRIRWVWLLATGFIATISYAIFEMNPFGKAVMPTELVMQRPEQGQVVSRVVSVAGKVTNADTSDVVWVVVHPIYKGDKFYVQDPIRVNKNGTWSGEIFVGKPFDDTIQYVFEIRAFIKPDGKYTALNEQGNAIFDAWPETAALATQSIVVIRKPKPAQLRSPVLVTP